MKQSLIFFIILILVSCGCPQENFKEGYFTVHFSLKSGNNHISFSNAGYTTVKNLEYERIIEINSYQSISAPLALNKLTSTFVIFGDSISDTLQFSGYKVEPYIEDDNCGYRIKMTEPEISHHTFSDVEKGYFDNNKYALHVTLYQ